MKILNAGANVVLTTGGIDDLCLKYFVEAGAMAVRRCKKSDLKRIAKATGAQFLSTLANLEGEEAFDASMLGHAEEVVQDRICDDELLLIKGYLILNYKLFYFNSVISYFQTEGKNCRFYYFARS